MKASASRCGVVLHFGIRDHDKRIYAGGDLVVLIRSWKEAQIRGLALVAPWIYSPSNEKNISQHGSPVGASAHTTAVLAALHQVARGLQAIHTRQVVHRYVEVQRMNIHFERMGTLSKVPHAICSPATYTGKRTASSSLAISALRAFLSMSLTRQRS